MTDRLTASEREALVKRVYSCVEAGLPARIDDTFSLLYEVERLTRERDEWVDRSLVLASESRVAVLTAEVERLREDAARLDYMDAQRNWTRWMGRDTGYGYTVWPVSGSESFRAAIDAARTTGGRDA